MTTVRLRAVLTAWCALAGPLAFASPLIHSIDRSIGSGENTIFFAIDFNDGQTKDFVTWSFSYNAAPGDGTVHQALLELDQLDAGFTYQWTDFGWGIFADGFTVEDPPVSHHQNRLDNVEDEWAETFSFWTAGPEDQSWTESGSGISDVMIESGNLYGFSWGEWPHPPPNAIPEPGVFTLVLLGIGVLSWHRTRR